MIHFDKLMIRKLTINNIENKCVYRAVPMLMSALILFLLPSEKCYRFVFHVKLK